MRIATASTAARDRTVKTPRLLRLGVEEVWLVDPRAQAIERHSVSAGVVRVSGDESLPSQAIEGFELTPSQLFG